MAEKVRVGMGSVTITLGSGDEEKEYTLVPTLAAAQGTSRIAGGLRGAIDSIVKLDLDVITRVVQLGLGPKVVKTLGTELSELVWQSGMTDSGGELASKCIEYLTMLSNGGRPLTPAVKTEAEGDSPL